MRRIVVTLFSFLAAVGCRNAAPAWQRAPLAPPLRLGEAVTRGEVLVLLVDAHDGRSVGVQYGGVASLTAPAAGFSRARVDSAGRIRFRGMPAGVYELRVNAFGYQPWRAPVAVSDTAAWVALAQLHRMSNRLDTVTVGAGTP